MTFVAIVASLLLLPFFLVVLASAVVVYYTDFRARALRHRRARDSREMLGYGGINGSDPARYALRSASPFSPAAMVPTAISVMGLSLVLFLPLIVPIDVFAAEREVRIGDFIRDLYYCTVAALLLFVFVLGPFAYFFHRQGVGVVGGDGAGISDGNVEENWDKHMNDEDEDEDDERSRSLRRKQLPMRDNSEDDDDEFAFNPAPTLVRRACVACQQTWMCLCVLVGLVVGSIVLHAGLEQVEGGGNGGGGTNVAYDTVKSVKALFRAPETGTMALNLSVAGFVLVGMCGIVVYTALGLVALPIISCVRLGWRGMRHGWMSVEAERQERASLDEAARWRERVRLEKIAEVEQQRALNTRERRHLYSKYGVTSRLGRMPKGAKKRSADLEARQVVLSRRLERLQEDLIVHAVGLEYGVDSSPTRLVHCWFESVRRLRGVYHACKIPLGVASIVLSIALWAATFVTCCNKFLASSFSHGYVIHDHEYEGQLYNPLDHLLRLLAIVYPLDLVCIGTIVIYALVATVHGMSALGVRVCCVHVHPLRRQRTPPSTVILFVGNLVFVMIAVTCHVLWIVPQYATFGAQMYVDPRSQEIVPCSLIGSIAVDTDASVMVPHAGGNRGGGGGDARGESAVFLDLRSGPFDLDDDISADDFLRGPSERGKLAFLEETTPSPQKPKAKPQRESLQKPRLPPRKASKTTSGQKAGKKASASGKKVPAKSPPSGQKSPANAFPSEKKAWNLHSPSKQEKPPSLEKSLPRPKMSGSSDPKAPPPPAKVPPGSQKSPDPSLKKPASHLPSPSPQAEKPSSLHKLANTLLPQRIPRVQEHQGGATGNAASSPSSSEASVSNEEVTTNVNDDEDGLQEIDAYVEEIDGERKDNQPRGEIAFGGFVKGGIEGHTPLINGTALVKPGACNPTELAILFNTVFVHFPLFGAAMQWLTVVYLFSFSVFFVVSFKKHPDQPWPQFLGGLNIDDDDDDEREEDEGKAGAETEESFGLLWSDEDREEEV